MKRNADDPVLVRHGPRRDGLALGVEELEAGDAHGLAEREYDAVRWVLQDRPGVVVAERDRILSCGPDANNAQRQTQVSFAPTTYVSATRFVALKSSHLSQLSDFKGKTVVSVSGSTNLKWLTEANAKEGLGMRIVAAPDHSDAFQTVASGHAVAFFMDDILLAGLVANSHDPHEWMISKQAYTVEPYGIIEPKGDPAFEAVDDAVKAMMKDGRIEVLYKKWFTKPIPPRGVNLNWPASAGTLQKAFAHPTDSPNPDDYR
ncbi:hypothetical protein CDEF62S_05727 [Castellaniella defragrans]